MEKLIFIALYFALLVPSASQASGLEKSLVHGLTPLEISQTKEFSSEKETLIYFWATWCPDCKDKLTSVFKDPLLYQRYNVILLATDKDPQKVKHFVEKNKIEPFVYLDPDRRLQKELKVFSVPSLVRLNSLSTESSAFSVKATQAGGDIGSLLK